ncbi:MAG: PHP domain-containing protein [Candidatus Cloacimonetes bacterium]|nr:PHP domain-containing protein [Candidatus Cloacimonadota bacterium]
MNYDFHLHTEFSYDSFIKGRELLTRALELNYEELAITEHLDLLPQELSVWGLPSLTKYSAMSTLCKRNFPP